MITEFSIEGSAPPHPTLLWKNNKKNDRNGSEGQSGVIPYNFQVIFIF